MKKMAPAKMLAPVFVLPFLTGCSSIAEYAAEARASIDKGRYEAISQAAMEDAKDHCVKQFQDKTDLVKENPELLKTCIEDDYRKRLDFYLANFNKTGSTKQAVSQPVQGTGQNQKVYSSDECIGAVVNGVCHGSIIPKSGYHKTCYGTMINGRCTGPMY